MELILFFVLTPIVLGVALGGAIFGMTLIGSFFIMAATLLIRFWYVVLIALILVALPVLYLDGWLNGVFAVILGAVGIFFLSAVIAGIIDYYKKPQT